MLNLENWHTWVLLYYMKMQFSLYVQQAYL